MGWVNILTKDSIGKFMLLTDEELGDGGTFCLTDLEDDGWERFADIHKTHQQAKRFMEELYPEYSELRYISLPVTFKKACDFVNTYHRHHITPQGHKFSLALTDGESLVAVAMVGRPVSRHRDDGATCEITRMCARPGHRNVCSQLYAKACRVAKEMGYHKIITYTLEEENGASLRAAGFTETGSSAGGDWDRGKGESTYTGPTGPKKVWEKSL